MAWWDFFKVFSYAFTDDPLSKNNSRNLVGAGISQIDAIPDIRGSNDGTSGSGSSSVRLRDTNDFVDLSTITNRIHRYKEYERLRSMPEIEMTMTVFADEACFAGETRVATPHGFRMLKELAENEEDKFLVYCYDFEKNDYGLGWAHSARKTKTAETIRVVLDDGSTFICTPDHKILLRDATWKEAGKLKQNDELMPFYRLQSKPELNKCKVHQYPRIFTHTHGWIHERQFVDGWRTGRTPADLKIVNKYCRMVCEGLSTRQIKSLTGSDLITIQTRLKKAGFGNAELKWLSRKEDRRKVISIFQHKEIDVYDLTVEKHQNFATEWGIAHNCQKNENGRVFEIKTKNNAIKEELEFLFFHRKMLNMDQKKIWNLAKQLFIYGDFFYEVVINPENPSEGIYNLIPLPPDSMFRMETTKGKLVEFQQSKEGPDYQSLARVEVIQATDADLQQATAIRFAPEQIIHIRIGDDRKTFYPYGVSLVEAARGPAHQLRLMEDAMVVYRLCLIGETRIRTLDGYKYIKDLTSDDIVYSYNENNQTVKTKVLNFINNGVKDVYKVRTKHAEITGTATHPILVKRDGSIQYVDIQDLIIGKDKIINVKRDEEINVKIPVIEAKKWAKLNENQQKEINCKICENLASQCNAKFSNIINFLTKENSWLPIEQAQNVCAKFNIDPNQIILKNKYQVKENSGSLPEFVNEDFARLFGFLIGDGFIRQSKIGCENQLSFASGIDEIQNSYYASLLNKFFGKYRFEKEKRNKNKNLGKYVVDSQVACRTLMAMGYIPGARNKRIPSWVFTAPHNIRKSFVEGISDADGCERHTKARTWFSTIELCNKKLVEDIKEIWSSIGLCSGKLVHRKRNNGHEIESGRKMKPSESYSVTISDNILPTYENVISVEHVGQEEVFDITVENELHNFIANGIPVHNTRAPERRVFYIDVQQLPPFKAEAFIERMKDQFRKKKVSGASKAPGASSVEERWQAPAADEDYWIPIRPNANTRVETLPGAQNLGEIDDTLYFRNKLFTSLNFPRNYFNNEDVQSTRIALSAQDVKFARMIERLQSHIEDAIWEICDRHLRLLGYPEDAYEDLSISMTPPSDWRELTRAEVITNRLNNASNLKGSQLMSDFDILTKWMKYTEEDAQKMMARLKIQKLEDLKLQIVAQNPTLLGVGLPGPNETEIGSEIGGPNPNLAPPDQINAQQAPPQGAPDAGMPPSAIGMRKYMDGDDDQPEQPKQPVAGSGNILPMPSEEDIKRFNLDIQNFEKDMDEEEVDLSEI